MLDHPDFVHGMFTTYFRAAGGEFDGGVKEATRRAGAAPFAMLESPPLYDIVRDINKLSNNVMARQVFLTLATTRHRRRRRPRLPPKWSSAWERKISMPGLVLENGSGLSRNERISAGGLAQLLAAADASPVREEFASSLAVAAVDGTVQRRFQNGNVAGQALLKTGSLEGVRALTGYVIDAKGKRLIVVAIINHPPRARRRRSTRWCSGFIVTRAAGTRLCRDERRGPPRGRLHERGEAQARSARPRVRAAADT